jgi:GGDEF domain-containing protein
VIAEKIRASVCEPIDLGHGATARITVSIGGVLAQPGQTSDAVLKDADQALYEAKQAGGNQEVVAGAG